MFFGWTLNCFNFVYASTYYHMYANLKELLLPYVSVGVQWNRSIAATLGEQHLGRYIGVVFIEGLFCIRMFIWDLDSWPLHRGGLYSGVAAKRGSTVYIIILTDNIYYTKHARGRILHKFIHV